MLGVKEFKELLGRTNYAHSLHVAVDAYNEHQFYIVGNGGMGNTISFPIERCLPEIKECVVSMISTGELIQDEKTNLLHEINVLVHFLKIPATQESDV